MPYHFVVIQQLVLDLHLVEVLQFSLNDLYLAQLQHKEDLLLDLVVRMDQLVFVVMPFLIDAHHLVASLVGLVQFGLHLADPLAVVYYGYLPTE